MPPSGDAPLPRRCGRHGRRHPLALRAAWRAAEGGTTPVVDAMFSRAEPRTGISGTLAWAVDVDNPATNEQFTLTLRKSCCPPRIGRFGGSVTRPCAMGSGNYPRPWTAYGQIAQPRHARARPGLDRHEAAQAAQRR